MRLYFAFSAILLFGGSLKAQVRWSQEISVTQLEAFNQWVTASSLKSVPSTVCGQVKEQRGLILCAFPTRSIAGEVLTRVSFWAEANFGVSHKTLFSTKDPRYLRQKTSASGFDLSGKDLLEFAAAVGKACATDSTYCWTAQELEFFTKVAIPASRMSPAFAVITYNLDDPAWLTTARHEVAHGQYFLDSCYREVADQLWLQVMTEEDRRAMVSNFRGVFSPDYQFLLRNEFQAFLLANPAQFISPTMTAQLRPVFLDNLQQRSCLSLLTVMALPKGNFR